MHRTLYIQEILLNAFGHCCPTGSRWTPDRFNHTRDLAALARTCRTFKDPALDVLWSELVDLSPLVRCIPDACRSLGPRHSFKRHLSEAEWAVLRSYTRRVWHITGYSNFQGWLDDDNLRAICSHPVTEPLFPNLRTLYVQRMAMIPVAHIAVPSLTTLDVYVTHRDVPVLREFLHVIGENCPNVKRFRIHFFHCQIFHKVVSTHVSRWKSLYALDFHGVVVNADTVSRFSEMPALAHLSFTLIPGVADWIPSGSLSVFRRLTYLETTCESLGPVTGLLSCTRLPTLQHLTVICPRRPSKATFRSYMTTVRNACSPGSLIGFTFFNTQSPRFPQLQISHGEPDERLTLDDLRPCMDFVNLRQVHVEIEWSVALTDSDLFASVSAWPRMQFLNVNARRGWRTTGGITLQGLLQLLWKCPSLSVLCAVILTETFTVLPDTLDEEYVPPIPLRVLLADSDIEGEDVPALVDAVLELAPYFQFISPPEGSGVGRRESAASREREWRRVFDGVNERLSAAE